MSENEALNGSNGNAKIDARFLSLLHRHYTPAMVRAWIARAAAGMRTRDGQRARWERTLEWLERGTVGGER